MNRYKPNVISRRRTRTRGSQRSRFPPTLQHVSARGGSGAMAGPCAAPAASAPSPPLPSRAGRGPGAPAHRRLAAAAARARRPLTEASRAAVGGAAAASQGTAGGKGGARATPAPLAASPQATAGEQAARGRGGEAGELPHPAPGGLPGREGRRLRAGCRLLERRKNLPALPLVGGAAVRVARKDPRGPPCARLLSGGRCLPDIVRHGEALAVTWQAAFRGVGLRGQARTAARFAWAEHLQLGTVHQRELLNMSLLPLYLLGLLLSSGQALLQVTISLSKVELSVGESKFFTCTAIGEPDNIDWYNPQGEKIVSSQRVVVQKEGVRSRLTIYNADIEDAGIYRCQATDAKGQTQEATVVLEIYQKLTFRDIVSPQEFRQGEDAEVVCRVTSSPAPIVSWLYRNEEVTTIADNRFAVLANNNLQILNINKSDEGVYRCEGRVEARGEIDFRDIIVIVNVPPAITLLQKSFNATADRGEAITLFCRATGSPPPEISWYRNGKLIEENEKYMLRGSNTELTIRDIKNIDAGSYICNAKNKAGNDKKQAFLQVFVQPQIIQLKNETTFENGKATLICEAEGEPIPEITWKRAIDGITFSEGDKSPDGRIEVKGQHGKSSLHIKDVKLSDSGRYDCEAASRIGGHQKSMYLDIEYAPTFVSNQTMYYSWEGNPINISCEVLANPSASVQWRRGKLVLPVKNTTHLKTYSTGRKLILEIAPTSDSDFGRYNCTATNRIGTRYQEYTLGQADVPSNPYGVRVLELSQTTAKVSFNKPDSHGGVPIHHYQVDIKEIASETWKIVRSHGVQTMVVLSNLEPNTTYEIKVAAVNGKGQGEYSKIEIFQTLPVREPSPPSIHGQPGSGKSFKLSITKQDDGGAPILEYIVKYRSKDKEDQWLEKKVQGSKDHIILEHLQWTMGYEVQITAANRLGYSEPTLYEFSMPPKPNIITDTLFNGLGLGAVIGLGVAALLLILVVTDVSCFFVRQCGLLMCITRRICGKKSGSSGKSKELEEGKAAYLKDGSKEPIVEMRTEDERITNHEDGSPVNEPNETTPLTEPEKLPLKEENGKEALNPETIEIKVANDIIQSKEDDSKA
ncbi:neural cell adhesion molecule 2 [Ciconia boyciana]|uniref:neural cell adhesion molecule 2 n=1 Tax=Ciconia boyciana TaxID=52775 RepID=UPI003B9DF253